MNRTADVIPRTRSLVVALAILVIGGASLLSQDLPPQDEQEVEVSLVTGEVVEVDEEAGVIVVHVEAIEDQEVEHFDLEVWIDEETVLENESDWEIASAEDLYGTLVDVEGYMDGDAFVADYVWVVEGPVDEDLPVETVST